MNKFDIEGYINSGEIHLSIGDFFRTIYRVIIFEYFYKMTA